MSIFDFFNGNKSSSKEVAKERLKVVLIHDRTDIPPAVMEQLRDEILDVIAKYVDFDRDAVDIRLDRENRLSQLVAEIPLRESPRSRRKR
jgi:cell division topological specificity factor